MEVVLAIALIDPGHCGPKSIPGDSIWTNAIAGGKAGALSRRSLEAGAGRAPLPRGAAAIPSEAGPADLGGSGHAPGTTARAIPGMLFWPGKPPPVNRGRTGERAIPTRYPVCSAGSPMTALAGRIGDAAAAGRLSGRRGPFRFAGRA